LCRFAGGCSAASAATGGAAARLAGRRAAGAASAASAALAALAALRLGGIDPATRVGFAKSFTATVGHSPHHHATPCRATCRSMPCHARCYDCVHTASHFIAERKENPWTCTVHAGRGPTPELDGVQIILTCRARNALSWLLGGCNLQANRI
jgi:hypothetical protein